MSALAARLQGELTAARKAREKDRVLLLGTTLSEIKNREIEAKRDLTDEDVVEVVREAIASGASAIGAVMGKVMPRFKGRLDGSVINRIAREELGTAA